MASTMKKRTPPNFIPSQRIVDAVALAIRFHGEQTRNGTGIPYLSHLFGVASLAMEHGADEDETLAAVLHDAIEDAGAHAESVIRAHLGDRVADIVLGCTDSIPHAQGRKFDWRNRKTLYLEHLSVTSTDVLLVSASDKLHNARAILHDLREQGDAVFDRFTAGRDGTLWYYAQLEQIVQARLPGPLANELSRTVAAIRHEAGEA